MTKTSSHLNRRSALTAVAALASLSFSGWASNSFAKTVANKEMITVWKTPDCGCCKKWVEHLQSNGFEVTTIDIASTDAKRKELGMDEKYASCHTGLTNGYVIEGHVPAQDVLRLIKDKPVAVGLSVPGMLMGVPGMESGDPKAARDAFSVMLVQKDGTAKAYKTYAAKPKGVKDVF